MPEDFKELKELKELKGFKDFIISKLYKLAVRMNDKRFTMDDDEIEGSSYRSYYLTGYSEGYESCAESCRNMVLELLEEVKK